MVGQMFLEKHMGRQIDICTDTSKERKRVIKSSFLFIASTIKHLWLNLLNNQKS
jgi:hypothetical protein